MEGLAEHRMPATAHSAPSTASTQEPTTPTHLPSPPATTPSSTTRKRKPQIRFSAEMGTVLLQEVLAHNPFEAGRGSKTAAWAQIVDAVGFGVDAVVLVAGFKSKIAASEKASGVEERKAENPAEKESKERDNERADGMRDEAMKGMKKRKTKGDILPALIEHVRERDEFNREIAIRTVANEENRLALERERLELEKKERAAFIQLFGSLTTKLLVPQ
ncbi:hypothetical protein PF006_g8579 [Phytophthora fragariae]|uniref:Uncharacterized protein n=1 Tax=Phytophthora fragariae TaxID=53985 RepID=A0A6A3U7R6_9STRA|nr:hypothetical protein PF006_g8579 [Phytophthora fragariae]